MEGMEQKLNSILSDPDMMSKIMTMAQSLGAGGDNTTQNEQNRQQDQSFPALPTGAELAMLQKLQGFAQGASIDREQQALLHALSPYLAGERIKKLEKAMRAARIASVASGFLSSQGLNLFSGG